jgi:hypothetical protein
MQLQKCFENRRGENSADLFGESTLLVILYSGHPVH